jgi:hypothetical protein
MTTFSYTKFLAFAVWFTLLCKNRLTMQESGVGTCPGGRSRGSNGVLGQGSEEHVCEYW